MRKTTILGVLIFSFPIVAGARDRALPGGATRSRNVPRSAWAALAGVDRGRLQVASGNALETRLGAFDLVAYASRVKSGANDDSPFTAMRGRYRIRTAGLAVSSSLFGNLQVRSQATLTRIKRHGDVPIAYPSRLAATGTAGVGLALDRGPSLMLDYVRTRSGGRSDPVERAIAIAGGAPMAGDGLKLSLSGGAAAGEAGHLAWSVSGSTMRRPGSEAGMIAAAAGFIDRRAEASLRMGF